MDDSGVVGHVPTEQAPLTQGQQQQQPTHPSDFPAQVPDQGDDEVVVIEDEQAGDVTDADAASHQADGEGGEGAAAPEVQTPPSITPAENADDPTKAVEGTVNEADDNKTQDGLPADGS